MITGEGGMVTTSDKLTADRLRLIVNHGQSEKYLHTVLGYNYRMTDISAAIGIVQLKKLDKFNLRRKKKCRILYREPYGKGLGKARGFRQCFACIPSVRRPVTEAFPLSRTAFMDYLKGKGIGSAVHYPIPIHRQPLYAPVAEPDTCPVATRLADSVLSLPVHPSLDTKDLAFVCETVNKVK